MKNNYYPNLGPPVNYSDDIPEFKKYGDDKMSEINIIKPSPFESVDDFKFSLIHGREVEFVWKNKSYGIFKENENGVEKFFIGESHQNDDKGVYFATVEELLNFEIQGQQLKEIINEVQVEWRNL